MMLWATGEHPEAANRLPARDWQQTLVRWAVTLWLLGVLSLSGYHLLSVLAVWRLRHVLGWLPLCGGWPYVLGVHLTWAGIWAWVALVAWCCPRRGAWWGLGAGLGCGFYSGFERWLCDASWLQTWVGWALGFGLLMGYLMLGFVWLRAAVSAQPTSAPPA